jgi:hypothetical protein
MQVGRAEPQQKLLPTMTTNVADISLYKSFYPQTFF